MLCSCSINKKPLAEPVEAMHAFSFPLRQAQGAFFGCNFSFPLTSSEAFSILRSCNRVKLNPINFLNSIKALPHHLNRLGIIVHQDKTPAHFQADRADGA